MSTAPVSSTVANSFVVKYYTLMGEKPQNLYHFYKENSVFTHGHEDTNAGVEEETVLGKENIGKKLQSLDLQECKVTLSVVDSQYTEDNGVMIAVIGHMATKRDPTPRKFIQTFMLAVQKEPRGFYIRNDIFRYLKHSDAALDQPASPATGQEKQPVAVEQPQQPVVEQKVEPVPQPTQVPSQPQPQPVAVPQQSTPKEPETPKEVPVQSPKPEPEVQKPTTPEKKEPVQDKVPEKPAQPVQEKKEEKKEEKTEQPAEKKPQEKRLKQPKQPNDKPKKQEEKKPEKPEKPAVPSWANVIVSGPGSNPPPQVILQMQKEKEEEKKQEKKPEKKFKEDQGNTVWISNLPFTISEEKVRAAFSKFGEITRIDLHAQKGFGFIEYATLDMVKQALEKCKAAPGLYLEGRPIQVEQRKKEKRPRPDRDQFVDKKDNKDRINGKPTKPKDTQQQPQQTQRPPKPQNDNPKPKKQTESNGQQGRPQKNL